MQRNLCVYKSYIKLYYLVGATLKGWIYLPVNFECCLFYQEIFLPNFCLTLSFNSSTWILILLSKHFRPKELTRFCVSIQPRVSRRPWVSRHLMSRSVLKNKNKTSRCPEQKLPLSVRLCVTSLGMWCVQPLLYLYWTPWMHVLWQHEFNKFTYIIQGSFYLI